MDTLAAIFTRRSIRKYTQQPIPECVVDKILRAAMVAPSAADERPWHFVVVQNQDTLIKLGKRLDHCEMLAEATLGILVCGDESLEKIKGYWVQDCSACTQNILLAAHALGVGAVWLALYPLENRTEVIRNELAVPDAVIPFALVSLGFPGEVLAGEDRFDQSRVHLETWTRSV